MLPKELRLKAIDTLLNARMEHTRWVSQVINHENPSVAVEHTDCKFGQWLLASEATLGHIPEFQALILPHKDLHENYKLLRNEPSRDPLRHEMRRLSQILISHIDDLQGFLNLPETIRGETSRAL
ncbi:MAG TPA: CZB domain-containing protein [Rhodocyclaceae bacterium]|nr:CZB domain-containing protein [Rhodocyclaceae bacterium]